MKKLLFSVLCIALSLLCLASCTGAPADSTAEDTAKEEKGVEAPAEILKIKDGAKAVIAITHDDGDYATAQFLEEQFKKNGLVGSVSLIAKNFVNADGSLNSQAQRWAPFFESGLFEAASHSWTHTFVGISDSEHTVPLLYSNVNQNEVTGENVKYAAGNLSKEISDSRDILMECFPNEDVLIYVKAGTPGYKESGEFIQLSPDAMAMIKDNYIAMRNTTGGLKGAALVEDIDNADLYNIHSLQVSATQKGEYWMEHVDHAIEKGGFMTYLFHRITDNASGIHANKSEAEKLFTYIGEKAESGEVWCAKFSEAIRYIEEYRSTTGSVTTYSDRVEIVLSSNLPKGIYNIPLTVKVEVDGTASSFVLTDASGSSTLAPFVEDGKNYVYANVIPNGEKAILTPVLAVAANQ